MIGPALKFSYINLFNPNNLMRQYDMLTQLISIVS